MQPDYDALVGSGFRSVWDYPNNSSAVPQEYGAILNFRILTSSQAPVARGASQNGRDVYYNTCLGRQALTHIEQDGMNMNLLYRGPEFSGMLGQNVSLAIMFAQAQAITQDTAIRNLLSTRATNALII